ncbi:hypothetical protein ABVT39_003060 [Epinephelus coioides]
MLILSVCAQHLNTSRLHLAPKRRLLTQDSSRQADCARGWIGSDTITLQPPSPPQHLELCCCYYRGAAADDDDALSPDITCTPTGSANMSNHKRQDAPDALNKK